MRRTTAGSIFAESWEPSAKLGAKYDYKNVNSKFVGYNQSGLRRSPVGCLNTSIM